MRKIDVQLQGRVPSEWKLHSSWWTFNENFKNCGFVWKVFTYVWRQSVDKSHCQRLFIFNHLLLHFLGTIADSNNFCSQTTFWIQLIPIYLTCITHIVVHCALLTMTMHLEWIRLKTLCHTQRRYLCQL